MNVNKHAEELKEFEKLSSYINSVLDKFKSMDDADRNDLYELFYVQKALQNNLDKGIENKIIRNNTQSILNNVTLIINSITDDDIEEIMKRKLKARKIGDVNKKKYGKRNKFNGLIDKSKNKVIMGNKVSDYIFGPGGVKLLIMLVLMGVIALPLSLDTMEKQMERLDTEITEYVDTVTESMHAESNKTTAKEISKIIGSDNNETTAKETKVIDSETIKTDNYEITAKEIAEMLSQKNMYGNRSNLERDAIVIEKLIKSGLHMATTLVIVFLSISVAIDLLKLTVPPLSMFKSFDNIVSQEAIDIANSDPIKEIPYTVDKNDRLAVAEALLNNIIEEYPMDAAIAEEFDYLKDAKALKKKLLNSKNRELITNSVSAECLYNKIHNKYEYMTTIELY